VAVDVRSFGEDLWLARHALLEDERLNHASDSVAVAWGGVSGDELPGAGVDFWQAVARARARQVGGHG
jgi:hypothetical protein